MGHGPHDNCAMCRMARAIGMMEKHPENCACEARPKKKDKQKDESSKVNVAV